MRSVPAKTVSAYIAAAPGPARTMLRQLRSSVRAAAPRAEETISYGMPHYRYRGRLTAYAAFKQHVSLFISASILERYAAEVRKYQATRSTLHFPLGTRVPTGLVKKLVMARRRKNEMAAKARER